MLTGKNGVLNRANEAKYTNEIAQFEEKVKLAQISLQASITAKTKSQPGYIATEENNFASLAGEVAQDLDVIAIKANSGTTKINTEGYTVGYYLDTEGNSTTDGKGYIAIWYTDNSLRSSMNREDAISKHNLKDITENKSVNQAVLVSVIHIENYGCELASQKGLTSTKDAEEDIKLSKYGKDTENGNKETTLSSQISFNETSGSGEGTSPESKTISFTIWGWDEERKRKSWEFTTNDGTSWYDWARDTIESKDVTMFDDDGRKFEGGLRRLIMEYDRLVGDGTRQFDLKYV